MAIAQLATEPAQPVHLDLTDGEANHLYRLVKGSIMDPDTRQRLRAGWGMCARHAAASLAIEAAARAGGMHAAAVLYADLIERAVTALTRAGPFAGERALLELRNSGPCLVCQPGIGDGGRGVSMPVLLAQARDGASLSRFMASCAAQWQEQVCPDCVVGAGGARCRRHLVDRPLLGALGMSDELREQRRAIGGLFRHLVAYARSFRWQQRDTNRPEDRAALIGAVGWCSGWSGLLAYAEHAR
jgi:hypothetical protein